ncbi:MAG: quinone oxidoreductase [Rickettsiales bacterium]|jgi:NADPH2:quinone reductase|nr:quinone oxidoreductase [Rickettsiales bacterium]|tara:strand:- start:2021 stop:2992 length:972 start_codon:yes stop_codon:yes gene_type:complete
MPRAIQIKKQGAAGVMKWVDIQVSKPKRGQILINQSHVGLNYIDVYHRSGLYPLEMPHGIGMEAAGTVEAVGASVKGIKVGDRVAYAAGPPGSYAEVRVMPADRVVKLPTWISNEQAAAMLLQGMTTEYLIRRTRKVKKGETVLFHAAAGGVGLIACQWLKQLGATVIGTVGSPAKAKLAKAHGCDHVINYNKQDFVKRVKSITKGAGVPVVYDSVGKSTYSGSLDCLSPLGMFVSFGNASGPIPAVDAGMLSQKGSLFFTRPTMMTYTADTKDLQASARALFAAVKNGVKIEVNQRYQLKDAVQAHRDLEARKTTGSTVFEV